MNQALIAPPSSPHNALLPRTGRIGLRMLAALALVGGSVLFTGLSDGTAAFASDSGCDGVAVVVDSTDIGGKLTIACAEGAQESGTAALKAAGFTTTEDKSTMICAIDSMPDPCPEVFEGKFWSYWYSTPSGEWTSYQVGADSSKPEVGAIEGWRYNDGTVPPGVAPAEVAAALSPAEPEVSESTEPTPADEEAVTTSSPSDQASQQGTVLTIATVGFLALVAVLVTFIVVRNRRKGSSNGDANSAAGTDGSNLPGREDTEANESDSKAQD